MTKRMDGPTFTEDDLDEMFSCLINVYGIMRETGDTKRSAEVAEMMHNLAYADVSIYLSIDDMSMLLQSVRMTRGITLDCERRGVKAPWPVEPNIGLLDSLEQKMCNAMGIPVHDAENDWRIVPSACYETTD